ncbi:aldose epimerase family protein [Coraliomargarita akajimensis]|uniref:Aldose 1-epimerase n=1 Tax=Coraliomargarita akajimensis (strain DSM 45221 / IAM 15411 / JCM 23193 / KCTC 12865 / 04OKA010-24) TaxID=583355 RepID=D5EQ64_CORAD|nr:aldose epimerase family protein [Coraliomargarita akajimensis]ADE53832.1 Aldose 1-epimerase [Coraliomargarita akajimensis DSM 45221]
MSILISLFGTLPNGREASLFTLENANGLRAAITNYGGIIVSLEVADKEGQFADIMLGKDTLDDYVAGHPHFACITGRNAGRIGGASFELDGQRYQLEANNGPNALHGGSKGFHQILWDAEVVTVDGIEKLQLQTVDPDGSNGFPGTVQCTVTYALLDDNSLEITYAATSDKATPFNITNHAYFNLRGEGDGDVKGHHIQILSDAVAAVDEQSTLTGVREPVRKGFNDYREPVQLGSLDELTGNNADIHFFLDNGRTSEPRLAASAYEPESGRLMEVLTTEPGVQFYAALFLDEAGKNGKHYAPATGFCFETQDYADSVHFPEMGGAILQPHKPFESTTIFKFSTRS